jgi:hypothetical protein
MQADLADRDGRTPLMLAAQHGRAATVKFLLEHGAKPGLRDRQGWDAYGLALMAGHDDVVKLFPHRDPIRVQVEAATSPENVYSSCAMTPPQLAQQVAGLQLDAVVLAALREFAVRSGKRIVQFVDANPQESVSLKVRPTVSCVQQQAADNLSLAIDARVVRSSGGAVLLEKTFGGGLKGLHAQSATNPAQYQPLFAEWAKAHAPQIYWAVVEAWLRAG